MDDRKDGSANKKVVLLIATMVSFLTPYMGSSINIALPSIGKEFAMNAVMLSWVATSYLLAASMFLLPFGRVADIFGRKRVFTHGILIYTISCVLIPISTSATMLILFRVLQGIGGAMIFGTGLAILTSVFPPGERGRALGINVAAVYFGLSLGPFLGGFLTHNFGWRSIFLSNVPLGLIIIAFIFWKLKEEWAEAIGEKFDFGGSLIYGLGLAVLIYGFSTLPTILGALAILIGISMILAFIKWETKMRSPILNVKLFSNNRVFAFANLAALIHYSSTFAVSFLLSLYLQYIKMLNPQNAGLILVTMPAMQAISSPIAGRLSDRIDPRILASIGMGITTTGLLFLTFIGARTNLGYIIGSLIFLGLGFGLFSSPNTNAIMSSVENRFYGVASATLATMRQVGMMFSIGIAMLVFALFIGRVEITPEFHPLFLRSMKMSFIVFAFLCFGGIFASLARGRPQRGTTISEL